MKRAFICHSSKDSKFVIEVCRFLKQNLDEIFYFEDYQRNIENANAGFIMQISEKLEEFEIFIAFISDNLTRWQKNEIGVLIDFQNQPEAGALKVIIPVLLGINRLPSELSLLRPYVRESIDSNNNNDTGAYIWQRI